MRLGAILISSILLLVTHVFGQTRTIRGKVINENLNPVYEARIYNVDTLLLVIADITGDFKIEIPPDTKSLIIGSVAMEWKKIDLRDDCNVLDIILLNSAHYDFMSPRKIDKLRKRDFDKLPAFHQAAFEKGIFKAAKPCYIDNFIPIKKELKEIHKKRMQVPST